MRVSDKKTRTHDEFQQNGQFFVLSQKEPSPQLVQFNDLFNTMMFPVVITSNRDTMSVG
jgi:hypothetical protein